MMNMKVEGLGQLESNLKALTDNLIIQNTKATDENLKQLVNKARAKAPFKTGTLKRSIDKKILSVDQKTGNVSGQFGSDLPYAAITELGGNIKPKKGKFLRWKDPKSKFANKDGFVFAKMVHHKASPFLMPALIESVDDILYRIKLAYTRAVNDSVKK